MQFNSIVVSVLVFKNICLCWRHSSWVHKRGGERPKKAHTERQQKLYSTMGRNKDTLSAIANRIFFDVQKRDHTSWWTSKTTRDATKGSVHHKNLKDAICFLSRWNTLLLSLLPRIEWSSNRSCNLYSSCCLCSRGPEAKLWTRRNVRDKGTPENDAFNKAMMKFQNTGKELRRHQLNKLSPRASIVTKPLVNVNRSTPLNLNAWINV